MEKAICIGKNYLEHAIEMQKLSGDTIEAATRPTIFLKPASSCDFVKKWDDRVEWTISKFEGDVHPECELVYLIKDHKISAISVGIDLTLRTLQTSLKKQGKPWEISKSFAHSALIGPWVDYDPTKKYSFSHVLNDKKIQDDVSLSMIFLPEVALEYVSTVFCLLDGDVIFSGTPAGVTGVKKGDLSNLYLENRSYSISWK
jgi:2-keto-4-pentenoate hydratase/2-oxohepta-3-ene-1,7-dioic acid hydratase in catechol pathway